LAQRAGTLVDESARDLRDLEEIMRRLEVRPNRAKSAAAAVAVRLGRLKLNGHLVTRSPLSTLTELDVLAIGAHAKQQLWENLRPHADVDELIARAEAQLRLLESPRERARDALH
jgi:hypothetical protein